MMLTSVRDPVRVLVADDTEEIRVLLRVMLESDGRFLVVGEAVDGKAAVDLSEAQHPDVALVDLAMPVLDGLRAIPEIKRVSPSTKIVVLSAFSAGQMKEQALAAGAAAYLEKGTPGDDLIEAVAGVARDQPPRPARRRNGSEPARPAGVEAGAAAGAGAGVEAGAEAAIDIDELLAHLNHELRTPVTILQGFASTLLAAMDRGDESLVRHCAESISRNVGNLALLVGSFADARAADGGVLAVSARPTDVAGLVQQTAHDLQMVAPRHRVVVQLDEAAMVIPVDPTRLQQVVVNLVSNAAKFSPPGDDISVTVGRVGPWVEVAVRDRGPGVPPDRRHQLFQKFGRLHTGVKGTGLGLYISRAIARGHGGDLVLDEATTDGARFVLRLPADAAAAAATATG